MPSAAATPVSKAQLVDVYRQAIMAGVPLEKVAEKIASAKQRQQVTDSRDKSALAQRQRELPKQQRRLVRWGALVMPLLFLGVGAVLVGTAVVPILNYYVQEWPTLRAARLHTPIPPEDVLDSQPLVIAQATAATASADYGQPVTLEPVIINTELDYTNLSNWFGTGQLPELANAAASQVQDTYLVDIPSLNIAGAEVTVGGTNLNQSLIQYPGTALPGEFGAPVIFGHSVLRQFYNPSQKNPRRYNSIFSTIMTMKKGDKIYVTHNNVKYTYQVQDKTEVKPQDTHILAQKFDSRQLKLVTCTPEGTYLRRGVVTAVLVKE